MEDLKSKGMHSDPNQKNIPAIPIPSFKNTICEEINRLFDSFKKEGYSVAEITLSTNKSFNIIIKDTMVCNYFPLCGVQTSKKGITVFVAEPRGTDDCFALMKELIKALHYNGMKDEEIANLIQSLFYEEGLSFKNNNFDVFYTTYTATKYESFGPFLKLAIPSSINNIKEDTEVAINANNIVNIIPKNLENEIIGYDAFMKHYVQFVEKQNR